MESKSIVKTGLNNHFRQCKNVKTEFFSGAEPLEPEGRREDLHPSQTPHLESLRTSLAGS